MTAAHYQTAYHAKNASFDQCTCDAATAAETRKSLSQPAVVIRERIFLGFLISIVLLVISTGCLRTANALELTKSTDSSGDYDDYVDSVETSAEPAGIVEDNANTDTHFNSYPNQIQTQRPEPAENAGQNDEEARNPSEIQKAVCTITAGEVKASAEAVTTKTLKGVCGSAELQLAVNNLESKIFKELASIKALLLEQAAPQQQQHHHHQPSNTQDSINRPTERIIGVNTTPTLPLFKSIESPEKSSSSSSSSVSHPNKVSLEHAASGPKLKSLHTQSASHQSRDKEVSKFNNTMLADKDVKIFTYYWRLENFTKRIESGHSVTIDSPRFAIKGKPLHLKAYFQHLHRDFLYVQLEYANSPPPSASGKETNVPPNRSSSSSSTSNSIVLDMGLLGGGSMFKAISSTDQILFKYKISILDQQNLRSTKDLISQEFHNLEAGFLIPNSALLGSTYIKDDTLLVQLFLYL